MAENGRFVFCLDLLYRGHFSSPHGSVLCFFWLWNLADEIQETTLDRPAGEMPWPLRLVRGSGRLGVFTPTYLRC